MKCAGCVQAVEKQLHQHDGVCSATVNLVTQKATVEYEVDQVEPADLAAFLTQRGFPSQVHSSPSIQAPSPNVIDQRNKLVTRLRQVMVAGLLVILSGIGHLGQIQGLTIPGLSNIWFHWGLATLALALPGPRDLD